MSEITNNVERKSPELSLRAKFAHTVLLLSMFLSSCTQGVEANPQLLSPDRSPSNGSENSGGESTSVPPTPESGIERPTIIAREYAGSVLNKVLAQYRVSEAKSYESDGSGVVLSDIDKPDGRGAFGIGQDEFVVGFGVNGKSWVMIKVGNEYKQMDYSNLTDADGNLIENAFAYSVYVDPLTGKIAENITPDSMKIPVLTVISDMTSGENSLLYYDHKNLSAGNNGFYQVIGGSGKAGGLASIVDFDAILDIKEAPTFVQEINFEGDWKVVLDYKDGISLIDVSTGENLGKYENGAWVEVALTPEQMVMEIFEQNGVDLERFNNETVTVTPSEDGKGFSVTDKETGKVLMENDGIQTKFEIGFVTDEIAAKNCEPTHYRPNANNPAVMEEDARSLAYYKTDIIDGFENYKPETRYSMILIDRDKQCWCFSDGQYFYYRDVDKVPHEIPLISLTKQEVWEFLFSRD